MADPEGLINLQKQFLNWLQLQDPEIKNRVVGTEHVSIEDRLGVYANAYNARLTDALIENYPATHTLLGDEGFFELAETYINSYPSKHFSIRWFGHRLGELLASDARWKSAPVLSEMALFEWTLRDAFDAEDSKAISLDEITGLPADKWGELGLVFHPSLTLLSLSWNVPPLWQAVQRQEGPIPPQQSEYPDTWVIWRMQDNVTRYQSLDVDTAWAVSAFQQGIRFEEVCSGLCEWIDAVHAPQRAAELLAEWINQEMVVAITD